MRLFCIIVGILVQGCGGSLVHRLGLDEPMSYSLLRVQDLPDRVKLMPGLSLNLKTIKRDKKLGLDIIESLIEHGSPIVSARIRLRFTKNGWLKINSKVKYRPTKFGCLLADRSKKKRRKRGAKKTRSKNKWGMISIHNRSQAMNDFCLRKVSKKDFKKLRREVMRKRAALLKRDSAYLKKKFGRTRTQLRRMKPRDLYDHINRRTAVFTYKETIAIPLLRLSQQAMKLIKKGKNPLLIDVLEAIESHEDLQRLLLGQYFDLTDSKEAGVVILGPEDAQIRNTRNRKLRQAELERQRQRRRCKIPSRALANDKITDCNQAISILEETGCQVESSLYGKSEYQFIEDRFHREVDTWWNTYHVSAHYKLWAKVSVYAPMLTYSNDRQLVTKMCNGDSRFYRRMGLVRSPAESNREIVVKAGADVWYSHDLPLIRSKSDRFSKTWDFTQDLKNKGDLKFPAPTQDTHLIEKIYTNIDLLFGRLEYWVAHLKVHPALALALRGISTSMNYVHGGKLKRVTMTRPNEKLETRVPFRVSDFKYRYKLDLKPGLQVHAKIGIAWLSFNYRHNLWFEPIFSSPALDLDCLKGCQHQFPKPVKM